MPNLARLPGTPFAYQRHQVALPHKSKTIAEQTLMITTLLVVTTSSQIGIKKP